MPVRSHPCTLVALIAVSCLAVAADVSAQPVRAAPPAAQPGAQTAGVGRADLAQVYLRLEHALAAHPPAPETRTRVERQFDAASLRFFTGGFEQAARELSDLTIALRFPVNPPASAPFAAALAVLIQPAVSTPGSAPAAASIVPIYGQPFAPGITLDLHSPAGDKLATFTIDAVPASFPLPANLPRGRYTLALRTGDGPRHTWFTAHWTIASESPDVVRERILARLDGIAPESPALQQALAACRARARLLTTTPSPDDSAQFLADIDALLWQVPVEAEAILCGEDPYRLRTGDYWRVIDFRGAMIPCRIYAPTAVKEGKPLPLIIALHGAGGDENMFLDGYGAGRIKQLADQHGFIVASPLTYNLMSGGAPFDALIEAMKHTYEIDASRIYLVGHSMGGMTAAGLATQRSTRIAAAVCIAGGNIGRTRRLAPTLIIGAEFDPLIPAARLQATADAARAAGLPVEYRLARGYGHTLLVGDYLGQAIEWLLQHTLDPE
jgi:predicted esterase